MLACVLLLGATVGCQVVKEGSRCKANAPLARNSTHVLRCVKGRWRKLITIDQATQIIVGTFPGSVESATRSSNVFVGSTEAYRVSALVKRRDGKVAPGVTVTFAVPGSGASATFPEGPTATTNADGFATIKLVPNTVAGSVAISATVPGVEKATTITMQNAPGPVASITAVSGSGQTVRVGGTFQPFVARVADQYGNPLAQKEVLFDWDTTFVDLLADAAETNGAGEAIVRGSALTDTGIDAVFMGVELPSGDVAIAQFDFEITP